MDARIGVLTRLLTRVPIRVSIVLSAATWKDAAGTAMRHAAHPRWSAAWRLAAHGLWGYCVTVMS